jgi:hypothetical protein
LERKIGTLSVVLFNCLTGSCCLGEGPRALTGVRAFKLSSETSSSVNHLTCQTFHHRPLHTSTPPHYPITVNCATQNTHRHLHITTTATMAQEDAAKRIEEAKKLSKDQPSKAEAIYKEILSQPPGTSDKAVREFETALLGLGELYRDHQRTQDLANLIQQTREVLTTFARAKTSKLSEWRSIVK